MSTCPNKNLPQWKELSETMGEPMALLAFFRNNNQIPSLEKARELTTDRFTLESFHVVDAINVQDIEELMVQTGVIYNDPVKKPNGENVFSLTMDENQKDILSIIAEKYGPIFQYLSDDTIKVIPEAVEMYNNLYAHPTRNIKNLSLSELSRRFLFRMGIVNIEHADDVISKYGSNGVSDFARRMVMIQEGKSDVALPEEAMHFFLEMMPQDDPALIEALDKIRLRPIYKQVLAKYSSNPEYQTKDGKPNFNKIRKEALAKEIATSLQKKEKQSIWTTLVNKIMDWIKGVNLSNDPFRRIEEMFLAQDISNLNRNIKSNELFFQLTDDAKKFYETQPMNEEQKKTFEKLLAITAKVDFKKEGHLFTFADGSTMPSVSTVLGSDFYNELDQPDKIADIIDKFETIYPDQFDSLLSDKENARKVIDTILDEMMSGLMTKDELEIYAGKELAARILVAMENKHKTLFGTAIHEIIESLILGISVDLQALSKDVAYFMDSKMLQKLIYEGFPNSPAIVDIIKELKKDGAILISEFEVGNGKLAGIIDLIAIQRDGTVKVYDFKTKFIRPFSKAKGNIEQEFNTQINLMSNFGVKNEPNTIPSLINRKRSLIQKYTQQQTLYKHLLMEGGVAVSEINVVGIPYKLDKETGQVDEMRVILVKNLPYDKNLGEFYFNPVDPNLDAIARPKVLKEDPRIKELESLSKEKMKEAFGRMLARITQVYESYVRKKDSRISDILIDDDANSDSVKEQQLRLEKTLENFDQFKNEIQRQKNFIEMIDSTGPIIAKIAKAFDELRTTTPIDAKARSQKLNELMKMKDFLIGYQKMIEEMLGYMSETIGTSLFDEQNKHILVNRMKDMLSEITNIRNIYVDTITPDIVETLGEVFSPEMIDNIKREINEMIASARIRKDTKRVVELEKMRDNLPSEKVLKDYLKGKKGDVGYFFSYLMATISNPDMVVASVAKRLKAALDRVRIINKTLRDSLSTELDKRNKVYGRGLDMKTRNESLVYDVKSIDEYTGEEYMKRVLKTEFDIERLHYDYSKLKIKLREEQAKPDNDAEIKKAKEEIRKFEKKYLEGNYTEEFERITSLLDTVVTYKDEKKTLREIRTEIFDKINSVHARYHPENIQDDMLQLDEIQELANHWANYHELFQKYDADGNPKTGEPLRIAQLLEEYKEKTKDVYENVPMTGAFERAKQNAKNIFGEDSDEYKAWYARNTRQVVKDEYYTEMDTIIKRMNELLPREDNIEITNLYAELRKLTNAYKDKDNHIQGQIINEETVSRIKRIELRIRELRGDQIYNRRGLTQEEQVEYNIEIGKRNTPEYDEMKVKYIIALGQKRILDEQLKMDQQLEDLYPDLLDDEKKAIVEEYSELRMKLVSMRKMEINPYYYEVLHSKMDDFAKSIGLTNRLDIEKNIYHLREFQQSKWFLDNHNFDYKKQSNDDGEVDYSYSPIYIWKRNKPIAKYIEQLPATHFYKHRVKESYTDASGKTVQLLNKDTRDILGRKKPKTNDAYRAVNASDHPYLNKEYIELRKKVQNNTATQKEKVDYENLLYLQNTMTQAQEKIEMSQRLGFAIPFMEKTKTERIVETKGQSLTDSAKSMFNAVKRALVRTEDDIDEGIAPANDISKVATVDNEQVKYIPVRYRSRGELANASYDVWGGVLNYVASINRKVELETELAFVNGLEEVLGDSINQPKSEVNNMVFNKIFKKHNLPELEEKLNAGSNRRLDVIKSFINSVMYNEEYFSGVDILGINTQKAVSNIMGLSSFAILAGAPLNWMTNLLSGNVQNIVEGATGNLFSFSAFKDAKGVIYGNGVFGGKYGSVMKDMMSDFDKVGNLSFWGQMMELFDPIQGEYENEYGQKTKFNAARNILKLGPFAGKVWGEWEIQMTGFIAFARAHKLYNDKMVDLESYITLKMGTNVDVMTPQEIQQKRAEHIKEFNDLKTTLLDIFEMKNGTIAVKPEFENAFKIGSQQFSDIIGKLHSMQKRINGAYAGFDRSYAEKTSLGRMIFFFRKYVIPLAVNRWGEQRINYEGMQLEQGFYLTFLQTMKTEITNFRFNVIKNWHTFSTFEKRAIKKTAADFAIVLFIFATLSLLLGWDEDDEDRFKKLKEKSWGHQALVYVLLKLRSETEQFIPLPGYGLNEIQRIYSNPSLIFSEVTRYIDVTGLLIDHTQDIFGFNDDNLYYKSKVDNSGLKDKGDSKLIAKLAGLAGYTGKTFNPVDAIKSFEYSQKLK